MRINPRSPRSARRAIGIASDGVEQGEGGAAEPAELGVAQPQVMLDRLGQDADDLPVDEIEGVGDDQQRHDRAAGEARAGDRHDRSSSQFDQAPDVLFVLIDCETDAEHVAAHVGDAIARLQRLLPRLGAAIAKGEEARVAAVTPTSSGLSSSASRDGSAADRCRRNCACSAAAWAEFSPSSGRCRRASAAPR